MSTFVAKRREIEAIQFTGDNYNDIAKFTRRKVTSEFFCGYGWCCQVRIDGNFFYLAKGDWLTFESVATGKDKSLECKIRWEKYNAEEFNRNYETY